jgi:hypothetical protein
LSNEESAVLKNALANLQLAYVETARGGPAPESSETQTQAQDRPAPSTEPPSATAGEPESRKKFTKSYGA